MHRAMARLPPPPWTRCSAFNGTLYLVMELAAMRFDGGLSRWLFAVPISLACLGTALWIFWDPHSAAWDRPQASVYGVSGTRMVWATLARTTYSILEQASIVAGVATLLEVRHPPPVHPAAHRCPRAP